MPKFSVIVPLYNKRDFIVGTIESILQQTYQDFEVIVVNDGSTDGSELLLKNIVDQRIQLIHQKNGGLSSARNKGIENATGSIIALLDADDLWTPGHLSALDELSQEYPEAALFGCGWQEIQSNGKNPAVNNSIDLKNSKHRLIPDFFEANLHQPLVCPSAFAFKKEIIKEIGGFSEEIDYGEDVDFYIRANLKYRFAFFSAISCNYTYDSQNQITQTAIGTKRLTNFDRYESENPTHHSLKKYLDRSRYIFAIYYKVEGNLPKLKLMRDRISSEHLSFKQRILLHSPRWMVIFLRKIKFFLLKRGIRVTSF